MVPKKNPKADIESNRIINIQIGIVLALASLFISFEYAKAIKKKKTVTNIASVIPEEDFVPITKSPETTPPPPPPPLKNPTFLVVDDDEDIEFEEIEFSSETTIDDVVEVMTIEGEDEEEDEVVPFIAMENPPEFPGGEKALMKWLYKTVRYPTIAQENGIQGRISVMFIIGKDGKPTDFKILRPLDPALDKEALRVMSKMPAWKPGKQNNKPVRVSFVLPIVFKLNM